MARFLDRLGTMVDAVVIAIGASLVVIVLINVVLHLFSRDLAWVIELGELLMVWVTFLGGVAAARRNGHMAITELLDKLPAPKRRWADAFVQALCLVLLLVFFVYGLKLVSSNWHSVLTTLGWPLALQYMPLPVSALLMMLFQGELLFRLVTGREVARMSSDV